MTLRELHSMCCDLDRYSAVEISVGADLVFYGPMNQAMVIYGDIEVYSFMINAIRNNPKARMRTRVAHIELDARHAHTIYGRIRIEKCSPREFLEGVFESEDYPKP